MGDGGYDWDRVGLRAGCVGRDSVARRRRRRRMDGTKKKKNQIKKTDTRRTHTHTLFHGDLFVLWGTDNNNVEDVLILQKKI